MKTMIKIVALASLLSALGSTALAQNTAFTYQGCVLDNCTNFTGAGQFKFALVTSTNSSQSATATANLGSGFVTSYNLIDGGSGYVSAPTVTISGGGGSGATATASITGGVVTAIHPGSAGTGYTSTPTVIARIRSSWVSLNTGNRYPRNSRSTPFIGSRISLITLAIAGLSG